ncbi:hypothetical protein CASFOL_029439 [Castilleja foliolosa]|uniref:Uncharacterized protein n=1 Tax=Castilleja foliolosa TaxID=1961234 RepID=A0ABD3CC99_9LAMI
MVVLGSVVVFLVRRCFLKPDTTNFPVAKPKPKPDASLAVDPKNKYSIQTKPHGHGDVHSLLYSTGLLKECLTLAVPSALGVSAIKEYHVNSLAVPRKAKEAIGGITKLTHQDGRLMQFLWKLVVNGDLVSEIRPGAVAVAHKRHDVVVTAMLCLFLLLDHQILDHPAPRTKPKNSDTIILDFRRSIQQVQDGITTELMLGKLQLPLYLLMRNSSTPQQFWLPLLFDSVIEVAELERASAV